MNDVTNDALVLGISAATGRPLPGVTPNAIAALAAREAAPDAERTILESRADPAAEAFAVVSEIQDPNDLAETGWGVVFARDCEPAVRAAMQPLLDRRRAQAGTLFKVFVGPSAPAPGEPATKWIARSGAALDVVDPHNGIPYYLLLVGSPQSISFEFQYTLDIYWAVGRLYFPTSVEYARYTASVIAYEDAPVVRTKRRVALFATNHDFDRATQLFTTKVAEPLVNPDSPFGVLGSRQKFGLRPFLGDTATKLNLERIIRGEVDGGAPALLFTGTHGMEFEIGDARQAASQGALVCQDWEGYGAIKEDHWFAARDVPCGADLSGLIHLCFACYSAGCPREDNFARTAGGPRVIANEPMIARLPLSMLAHEGGGALASLGHVDRAWAYSFVSERNKGQVQGMRDVLSRIMRGDRLGHAIDQMNIRWAALSTDLTESLEDLRQQQGPNAALANRWIARDDARNYVILGDPAVRLRVKDMAAAGG